MKFECRHLAELPFNLNLPEGIYEVPVSGHVVKLGVSQGRIAAHFGKDDQSRYWIASKAQLDQMIDFKPTFLQRLRTVAELSDEREIPDSQLHEPTEKELQDQMVRALIIADPGRSGENLQERAAAKLAELSTEKRAIFRQQTSLWLTAMNALPGRVPIFQRAVNTLVRLYMVRFNDFFVEEVAIHQLAGMVTSGVLMIWLVDGQVLQTTAHVEKIPGIMRGQWFDHGAQAVADFREALRKGEVPDSVQLLAVRARGFLERGAFRSAIIESSAALETAVTRRIQRGLAAAGKTPAEIASLLKTHVNFRDRAKTLLKQATGTTAAALDSKLWHTVLGHRENYRHRIAHSDLEPAKGEAETAVTDFTRLATLVSQIP